MKFVAIDKPAGMTSHDVVNQVRRIYGEKKVGHGGTLDPLATGVLIVGIGREATRLLGTLSKSDKDYEATIRFGGESTTDDAQGKIESVRVQSIPSRSQVETALAQFVGVIEQVPPQFSSVKIKGKSAHYLARQGVLVHLKSRRVNIYNIEIKAYTWPDLSVKVGCGSGTYIRSLARDLGRALGVGGYITELRRIRVGDYGVENCLTLEKLGMQKPA